MHPACSRLGRVTEANLSHAGDGEAWQGPSIGDDSLGFDFDNPATCETGPWLCDPTSRRVCYFGLDADFGSGTRSGQSPDGSAGSCRLKPRVASGRAGAGDSGEVTGTSLSVRRIVRSGSHPPLNRLSRSVRAPGIGGRAVLSSASVPPRISGDSIEPRDHRFVEVRSA
jgi:hypothetical protein